MVGFPFERELKPQNTAKFGLVKGRIQSWTKGLRLSTKYPPPHYD